MSVLSRVGSGALGVSALTTLAGGVVSVHLWLRALTGSVDVVVSAPSSVAWDREVVPTFVDPRRPLRADSGRSVDARPSLASAARCPGAPRDACSGRLGPGGPASVAAAATEPPAATAADAATTAAPAADPEPTPEPAPEA